MFSVVVAGDVRFRVGAGRGMEIPRWSDAGGANNIDSWMNNVQKQNDMFQMKLRSEVVTFTRAHQSLSELGGIGEITSSSVDVSVFAFVLTFTLGDLPRLRWFSIWTTVVVTMMILVMATESGCSSAGGPNGAVLL